MRRHGPHPKRVIFGDWFLEKKWKSRQKFETVLPVGYFSPKKKKKERLTVDVQGPSVS